MTLSDPLPAREILDSLQEGLYVLDPQRRITFWNKGAELITGFSAQEVVGKSCADNILVHVDEAGTNLCEGLCPVAHTLADGQFREAEVFLHHKNGHRLPVLVRVAPLRDQEGKVTGAVEIFGDNSSRREERRRLAELEKLALLDTLTQVPNRRYMQELMLSRLEELKRAGWSFGVLYMDLDHFKQINDTHGHNVGDEVLKAVAGTLEHVSRPYDVVGRWGGEEFLGLVPNINLDNLNRVAQRYRALVERSRVLSEHGPVKITISVGGTLARPTDDMQSLLARADQNLYRAKEAGRNQVVVD